jgi:hypothetical protein
MPVLLWTLISMISTSVNCLKTWSPSDLPVPRIALGSHSISQQLAIHSQATASQIHIDAPELLEGFAVRNKPGYDQYMREDQYCRKLVTLACLYES